MPGSTESHKLRVLLKLRHGNLLVKGVGISNALPSRQPYDAPMISITVSLAAREDNPTKEAPPTTTYSNNTFFSLARYIHTSIHPAMAPTKEYSLFCLENPLLGESIPESCTPSARRHAASVFIHASLYQYHPEGPPWRNLAPAQEHPTE